MVIFNVDDENRYLYHYTTSEIATRFILHNGTLRLGRYIETNDPKETKTWRFDHFSVLGADFSKYKESELSSWLSGELKHRTRLVCFSRDSGPLTGNHLQDISSRGFCKPRMWAQYGGKHKGVCLVFDSGSLAKKVDEQIASRALCIGGDVKYIDRSIAKDLSRNFQYTINLDVLECVGRAAYPEIHLRKFFNELFFEKMVDWSSENEWRWVFFSPDEEDVFLHFGDSLVGLMFGEETSEADISEMKSLTRNQLHYQQLRWKNCSPWYDFTNNLFMGRKPI